jgi:hypothetical protein
MKKKKVIKWMAVTAFGSVGLTEVLNSLQDDGWKVTKIHPYERLPDHDDRWTVIAWKEVEVDA